MQGPKIRIQLECFGCEFCTSESYACQGDSGSWVHCVNPDAIEDGKDRRPIGDTRWVTPDWCPLREAAISKMVTGLTHHSPGSDG